MQTKRLFAVFDAFFCILRHIFLYMNNLRKYNNMEDCTMAEFQTLRRNARGTHTQLLQLGLSRAGYTIAVDGIFGSNTYAALRSFQSAYGLSPDGVAGQRTWRAIYPYLSGYVKYKIRKGDTLYRLANVYYTTVKAIETANPGISATQLRPGQTVTIPLGFPVVPTNINFTSLVNELCIDGLTARYPFILKGTIGKSVMGRELACLIIGNGANGVSYNAAHHGNEWITGLLLLTFLEEYAKSVSEDKSIFDSDAKSLYDISRLYMVPLVNPDGVDIATGEISSGSYYEKAKAMAAQYPDIPFPTGWKANIDGIDTNLQYPAGWENAKEIKFAQGFTQPGPRDYVGSAPLVAPESRAMFELTRNHRFELTLSYHTQGEVIYWKYLDYEPVGSRDIASKFAAVSGYEVEDTPRQSGFAGYKDWFISSHNKPGYTIEAGLGESPVPLTQFGKIYTDNIGILVNGLKLTSQL